MTVVVMITGIILAVAALGAVFRIARGPSLLDRVLATDVLLAIVAAALAVDMAAHRRLDNLVLLVTISLIGFIGSVVVARFVSEKR